ncbi:AAA family ATPase [Nocardia terpenica]|uniref:Nuclease SbcCD subunit C n=1 Tax=Nocardia terpenica TaxID=455432 RepID=A0A6G9ZAZ2_9NOCA|nr:SMC family ATPase [Nocardia terpenica]QIS22580.1 AAA family ATPase [Nocardia terpenica]
MRLHRLEMTAFGPFAETATVDFDELGADGLFLLHGQTGAGKTTVLDAIAFALYGRVPGARGESKRLHSDHADPQTAPRVVLEATLGGRRLRLIRSPEFERPKKRGTGWRTEQAAATLEWLDGRGQHLSRIPDIGDEVVRLLGMSADQFFQVVLLPQGDFARFLRSENEEREKLLEKLFDTERFGTAEQWLAQRRRDSAAEVEAQRQSIDRLIAQVGVAAGVGATETVGPLEAVDWSQALLATARADVASTTADLERGQQDSARAQTEAERQRRLHDLRRRLAAARGQLEEYAAAAEHRTRLQGELETARRAEPVAAALTEARAAAVTLRRHTDTTRDLAERLASRLLEPASGELGGTPWAAADLIDNELAGSDLAEDLAVSAPTAEQSDTAEVTEPVELELFSITLPPRTDEPAAPRSDDAEPTPAAAETTDAPTSQPSPHVAKHLDTAVQRWTAQIGALDEVRADAESAVALATELAGLRAEYGALTEQVTRLTARRAQLPEAIGSAETAVRAAEAATAELRGLQTECERLRAAATAAVELADLNGESARATAEFEAARAAHIDARERTLDVRERRLAGMAAELAGALADGQPCSVCGSTEHPAPAAESAVTAAKEDEERAVAAERAAEAARDRALARTTELQRRREVLVERGGDGDKAELAAALDAATRRYESARTTAARTAELTAELSRLRGDETRLQDELRELESRCSATQERILAADRRLAELTERLRAAAGADDTVERRRARLTALIQVAEELRTARADAAAAREQVATLARRVEQLARAAGLVSGPNMVVAEGNAEPDYTVLATYAKVVDAATRAPERQAAIEAELVAADRAHAHARAVLAEPEIQAAATAEPGDLAELESLVAQARTRLDVAVAAHAEAARRAMQLEELSGQLWAAVDRVAPMQRAHEELAGLAEVVAGRGENNRRMSLRSYVLAARLEEVAVAGSVRLRRMSGGRYEFVHSDAAGRHGRRGGLGLDIRDAYTGAVRPATTLSGGETFMASLSLALGLADVVAAESGGLILDTLFIDEGFGSLDADTLDAVMGVLDELRSGGRVVGLVSHVDEMRQRIPTRLHVIREPTGSRLRTIVA